MRGLVQRVQSEPPASVLDRLVVRAPLDQQPDQAPERHGELPLQRVGLVDVPGLELRAVAQEEALEQLAAEELHCLGELAVGRLGRRERAEAVRVDGEPRALAQRHAVGGGVDPLLTDPLPHRGQRAPQLATGVVGRLPGPQQHAERFARPRAPHQREWASSAVALRVSNETACPAARTRGGPSSEISSGGATEAHRNGSWTPVGKACPKHGAPRRMSKP
jgi:hypothetical protein